MKRLENKIAIITGGGSGIGKATAKLFCKEGATVVIVGIPEELNLATVKEITEEGGCISAITTDISSPEACKDAVSQVIEMHGCIDVLVNNAGITDRHKPITRCEETLHDKVLQVNQYAVYYMAKYTLEHMEKVGKGSIVNISSIGAKGISGIAYSAAKAAVNAMTKNIAIQFAATDIRCNAVGPGPTPTPFNTPEQLATFDKEFADKCNRHIDVSLPFAAAEDQAEAVLFFASDAAKAITGQILYVDHGISLYGG